MTPASLDLRFIVLVAAAIPAGCQHELPETRSDGAVRITRNQDSEQNPCVSPDGQSMIFTRFSKGYNEGPAAVLRLDLATNEEEVLLDDGDHDHVNLPGRCLSPDGRLLAYASDAEERDEVWVLDLETGDRTRLTDHSGRLSIEPSFSHDGQQLFYQSSPEDEHGTIRRVAVDGSEDVELTDGSSDDRQPNAHPSEDVVLFQSDRGGTWGLWTMSGDGGEATALYDTPAEETDASYSPDGSAVVFATDDCGALSCAAILSDGEVEVMETPGGWYEGAPALDAEGTVYVEATDGDPDEGLDTAIYRLP